MPDCDQPGCGDMADYTFAFPGQSPQFICEEHRAGRDGLMVTDPLTTSSMVAKFQPLGSDGRVAEPEPPPPDCTLCGLDPRPAVFAYQLTNEYGAQVDNALGFACPQCGINLMQRDHLRIGLDLKIAPVTDSVIE